MDIGQLLADKDTLKVESIGPDATIREAAGKLVRLRIGALVVADKHDQMVGIVSERDLIPVVANYNAASVERPVSEVMTQSVITCGPRDEIAYVLRLMNKNAIRHMPVLDGGRLCGMLSIRELTRAYELLQIEANTDPLTEVSNRRPFLKTLEMEFDRARRFDHPLCVAMVDIDHFKSVNDTYGHDAGDKVLRAMSGLLISEFRTIDMVGRLGGEEFALVFPHTDLAGARIACNRLVGSIRGAKVPVDGATVSITVSVGIATATAQSTSGAAVLKRADEMLYTAKAAGRDRIVTEGDQNDHTLKALA